VRRVDEPDHIDPNSADAGPDPGPLHGGCRSLQPGRDADRCDAASATVALGACQTALSAQRQLTIAYDNALRAIPFTGTATTEAGHLLGDDAAIEKLLEQAATAPAITVIATLQQQVIPLLATAATDATALRQAIGLPAPA
jgi:hypothetical protein